MSFAVVGEGVTLIAYIVILWGGKQKREAGWKVLSGMLFLVGLIQCTGMALIVSFPRPWRLLQQYEYSDGASHG